jgi:hypothetical protein
LIGEKIDMKSASNGCSPSVISNGNPISTDIKKPVPNGEDLLALLTKLALAEAPAVPVA